MKTILTLRAEAKADLGFSYNQISDLSAAQKETLYDRMADIVAATPMEYDDATRAWANTRRAGVWYHTPLASQSIGDAVGVFAEEFANQAAEINDAMNPFSERNRKVVFGLMVLGAAVYFLAPVVIAALEKK